VYTPNHEGSVATLSPAELARVVAVWQDRTRALWDAGHAYVMAFENRGPDVGATLTHPHGQLYALPFVPPLVAGKVAAAEAHRHRTGSCVGCDLVAADDASARRVEGNGSFTVAVPFAAQWPFEVHLRVRRHGCRRLSDLTATESLDLARALRAMVHRYDGLFGFELPYMMVVQEAPAGCDDWHLHVELLPVHRSRDRFKVRASVETALGVFINDTLPEHSAERLAAVSVPTTSWEGVAVPVITRSRGGNA
jgi:UDPglucose--hexose-1-phosphate uridylyltransferase